MREPLEIFPVAHHSPSSAIHMVRRLGQRPPRVIFMEGCEDLRPLLDGLRDCKLPVALQAFASTSSAFPPAWFPLNLVCPLTEFSAEFQAIAFSLENADTELVFVDRSVDHVYRWMPQDEKGIEGATPPEADPEDEDAAMHGSAVGIEIGSLVPTYDRFCRILLKNARVSHYREWWDQFVEEAVIDGDYAAYRQVMFLVGSLIHRLGTNAPDLRRDELRERHMWTRMKEYLRDRSIDPRDALYICGAAHAASHVPEFGIESEVLWEVPPRSETTWHYGLIPSSYGAICHQFGHPAGTVTLDEARWRKGLGRQGLRPFALTSRRKKEDASDPEAAIDPTSSSWKSRSKKTSTVPVAASPASIPAPSPTDAAGLRAYLEAAPKRVESDEDALLQNCVKIVALARQHGYLASAADSIAVYQTAILLANMRNRNHPTPYDFRDAAVTCIEKDVVPGKRSVTRLCDRILGGDRVGQIGFDSMPPLARDVYERLAMLPIQLTSRTIQRALLDFRKRSELLPCSDLLWKLRYLLPSEVVRPIMGQRQLGHVPQQESWDVAIGKHQGAVIQLGYEGITVEYVLERRLKKAAFGPDARTVDALRAAEDSILFLKSDRLTEELGERAGDLLVREPDVQQAREIHVRISRVVHYYRTTESGLPDWTKRFITTGYSHYATLLPNAFADRGINPGDLAAMLQFIFTLESLALSLGCERSELIIAVRQSALVATDPTKLALLWSAECVLRLRELSSLRAHFDALIDNDLLLPTLPEYLGGFLLALAFTPMVTGLTVELLSKAFERLPDRLLMPWLPKLLMLMRPHAGTALPTLLKEAVAVFPSNLDALNGWRPPWSRQGTRGDTDLPSQMAVARPVLDRSQEAVGSLLAAFPATTDAIAAMLGVPGGWASTAVQEPIPQANVRSADEFAGVRGLLDEFPAAVNAIAELLGQPPRRGASNRSDTPALRSGQDDSTRALLRFSRAAHQVREYDGRGGRTHGTSGITRETEWTVSCQCRSLDGVAPLLRRERDRLFPDQQPDPAAQDPPSAWIRDVRPSRRGCDHRSLPGMWNVRAGIEHSHGVPSRPVRRAELDAAGGGRGVDP